MPLTSDTTRNVVDQEYDLQDQTDELPYWPTYGKDLAHELTAPELLMMLAARIPPELFDDILFYVNDNCSLWRKHKPGNYLERNRGEPSTDDTLVDLKQCSLVCLFWANRCRKRMFRDRTLSIRSYEDAKIFRQYIIGGCPRLTPMPQLISRIEVIQNYSAILAPQDCKGHTSFLHLLYHPAIQDKLKLFFIEGPVPDSFNPVKLDTPHWGIPPCIVAPSSFLLNTIFLKNIHLPSFYHVTKYIRHFSCATDIEFDTITWDGQMALPLPHVSTTIACQRRPRCLSILATGVCTGSVHLALTALMLNPNCPLHRLSDEERVWMIKFMTLLWGDTKDPYVEIGFDVSDQTTAMELRPFHFVFEGAPPTDRSASALRVVGMHAYIDGTYDLPANFDALVNHLRTHTTIRAFILLFQSFAVLQESMKPFVHLLGPATETIDLVLAYEEREEREERRAAGVDLVTLEPSGHIWTDLPELVWYEEHLRSLHILERQLEKKPRLGRLH